MAHWQPINVAAHSHKQKKLNLGYRFSGAHLTTDSWWIENHVPPTSVGNSNQLQSVFIMTDASNSLQNYVNADHDITGGRCCCHCKWGSVKRRIQMQTWDDYAPCAPVTYYFRSVSKYPLLSEYNRNPRSITWKEKVMIVKMFLCGED